MGYQRRMPPRAPRDEELTLLEQLLDGPKPISEGPLGRCLKRGWCRYVEAVPNSWKEIGREACEAPRLELTEAGQMFLENSFRTSPQNGSDRQSHVT